MKKTIKLFGIIALIAVIGFSMITCGDDGGGGDDTRTVTYSGTTSNGDLYSLKIIENKNNPNRAALDDPMAGDNFEFTWKQASDNSTKKSTGKVTAVSGDEFTMLPSHPNTNGDTFTATRKDGGLSAMSGEFTWTDGTKTSGSGTLTPVIPSTPPSGSGGTFTVTGIPAEYNGKYATFSGNGDDATFFGGQSLNTSTQTWTLVRISSGSVSLPMWWASDAKPGFVRYSGNNTVRGAIAIYNSATLKFTAGGSYIDNRSWETITFSNGSATRTWSSGTYED